MESGNPLFGRRMQEAVTSSSGTMTIRGTSNKAAMLLAMVVITAGISWQRFMVNPDEAKIWMISGALAGFVTALVLINRSQWAPVLAPAYALMEGLMIGALSAFYEQRYGGIVFEAVGLTFATMGVMLVAYSTGVLRATPAFVRGVMVATTGLALYYVAALILSLFHVQAPMILDHSPLGIAFSVFVVGLAALNLILDFAEIENAVDNGYPKYMEWYGAFGLVVTLIWMYLEFLRLLSKLRD